MEGDWLRGAFRWKTALRGDEERPGHHNSMCVRRAPGERSRPRCCPGVEAKKGPSASVNSANAHGLWTAHGCVANGWARLHPLGQPRALLPLPVPCRWGYWSTDGLGLFENMLLAEELGAEPVWVVNNGGRRGLGAAGAKGSPT